VSEPLIRHATPDDVDGIVEVYLASARHHAALAPDAYRVPAADAARERFSREMAAADDEDLHLVAVVDGRIVGHADATLRGLAAPGSMRIPERTAQVGIAVLDEWRGRGLGTMLMDTIEDWAREAQLDALVLDVATGNDGARRLYERLGYRPVSEHLARPLRDRPAET
jgi:GNAT superfamily N-acetyltransferase